MPPMQHVHIFRCEDMVLMVIRYGSYAPKIHIFSPEDLYCVFRRYNSLIDMTQSNTYFDIR